MSRILTTSLLILFSACGKNDPAKDELSKREGKRQASPIAAAPAGGRWKRAWVEVSVFRIKTGGSKLSPDLDTRYKIEESLVVDDGAKPLRLPFGCGRPRPEDRVRRADANYLVEFAPDGHAAAISDDDGKSWQYVPLDLGEHNPTCGHLTFEMPWSRAPATGDWLISVAESTPHRKDLSYTMEKSLLTWATGHPDGEAFHVAMARLAVAADDVLKIPGRDDEGTAFMQETARKHAKVRAVYLDAMRVYIESSGGSPTGRARFVLMGTRDAEAQVLLARAVRFDVKPDVSRMEDLHARGFAYALARMTIELRSAPEEVRAILAETLATSRGEGMLDQLYCLQALVAVDPELARAATAKLPGVPCPHEGAPWSVDPSELRRRSAERGWDGKNKRAYTLCCYVTAALESLKR